MNTFFATSALEDISISRKYYSETMGKSYLTSVVLREAERRIKDSIKFRIPDNGRIMPGIRKNKKAFGDFIDDFIPDLRLPYKDTLLEYEFKVDLESSGCHGVTEMIANEEYTGVILLSSEVADGAISIIPLWKLSSLGGHWTIGNFSALIDRNRESVNITPITKEGELHGANSRVAYNDMVGEVSGFLEFIAALACSNSATSDQPHGREKLNKKREKQGRPPFYSYKVLTISQGGQGSVESMGGSHRSPRVHLRRGHIRRLPNKTVWVNASVVGDKSKGFVDKDYSVQMAKAG